MLQTLILILNLIDYLIRFIKFLIKKYKNYKKTNNESKKKIIKSKIKKRKK